MTDEQFDEELSDAFRILSGGRAAEEGTDGQEEDAGEQEEPFTLPAEVAELFEKPESAEAPEEIEQTEAGASPAAGPDPAEEAPSAGDGITQD